MKSEKWGEGFAAETPVAEVLQQSWFQRKEPVLHVCRKIVEAVSPDPELLHQLRVTSRRLQAVLSIFREQLPQKLRRRVKDLLHELRNLAGPLRDLDVFGIFFEDQASTSCAEISPAKWESVRERLQMRREYEIRRLKLALMSILPHVEMLFRKVDIQVSEAGEIHPVADTILRSLAEIARTFSKDLQRADRSDKDLHSLRIQGKKFRYALELFAPLFPDVFREDLYPRLENLQEELGKLQDSRSATSVIKDLTAIHPTGSVDSGEFSLDTREVWEELMVANRQRRKEIKKHVRELIRADVQVKLGKRYRKLLRAVELPGHVCK